MRNYELVVLLEKQEDTDQIKKIINKIKGKIEKEEFLGKKPLAYPIKKRREAFFYLYQLSLPASQVTVELRKYLNFEEKLLRYLLLVKS